MTRTLALAAALPYAECLTLTLRGRIPIKKNRWRMGHLPPGDKAAITALEWQVAEQWHGRKPLRHPWIEFQMATKQRVKDRDGMVTTLLDVLVKCHVLTDDNIAECNGMMIIHPAVVLSKEQDRAEIKLLGGVEERAA